MGLDRKVAIVTGASRGIGKAIAIGLGREGAKVVVAARTEQETGKLLGTIHETVYEIIRTGGEAIAVKCNVASEEDAESLVARTLDAWGQVDVLVNNAGIGSYLPFTEVSVKHWDLVTAVNLRGPFLCTKFVLPELTRRGTGSILNISSHAAGDIFSMTAPNTGDERVLLGAVYGATKAALERFTRSLAAEFGQYGIAANALRPARPVMSEGLKVWRPDADFSQWTAPDNMVRAALYLADQTSDGCTGAVLTDEECILRHGL